MKAKNNYRMCPYCHRKVPLDYNFSEHKRLCKEYTRVIELNTEKNKEKK